MTTMIHESECVKLQRHGAEYVAQQLAGKSIEEQLQYWQQRTESLLARQQMMRVESQLGEQPC